MPSNSAEYQREYRKRNSAKRKVVPVAMSAGQHREIRDYASSQGMAISTLLREATLHQTRGTQLHSKAIEQELKDLRFLISNVANNMNQIAHHSNRVKHVLDENGVLQQFAQLDQLIVEFVNTRLKQKT